jgi:hypothetical protein
VLEPSEAQRASDLIKLSRQLGESFGIAILSTYVTTHIQMHRADSHLQSVLDQSRRHGEIVS